jgi:hypothetical protein
MSRVRVPSAPQIFPSSLGVPLAILYKSKKQVKPKQGLGYPLLSRNCDQPSLHSGACAFFFFAYSMVKSRGKYEKRIFNEIILDWVFGVNALYTACVD